MRMWVVLLTLSLLLLARANTEDRKRIEGLFLEHIEKYRIDHAELNIDVDHKDYGWRYALFETAVKWIENSNADPTKTHKVAVNKFAHMTEEEKDRYRGLRLPPNYDHMNHSRILGAPSEEALRAIPASVDWEALGALTPVKDQASCGSCWAFSACCVLEGVHQIKTGELKTFSEQELVSCDTSNSGCGGGWMNSAFTWLKGNGGIPLYGDWPYESGGGVVPACDTSLSLYYGTTPASYVNVASNYQAVQVASAMFPLASALDSKSHDFMYYTSGIITTAACWTGGGVTHAVNVVGYGTDSGTEYFKVRNSWGTGWGDDGYCKIAANANNICGINGYNSYPVV